MLDDIHELSFLKQMISLFLGRAYLWYLQWKTPV